ncbi:bifunctional diaminohydroxyphosphoribosylaminopyrimidine deaminase/5-amino-6-(5-phosphoribosylamino)uracil reductase RibD [Methylibium sp.]|uniref:bifunctional diaminohydroxyphosphoribosylaminopyrimidine deaminase/5-amino-6-(5-phosphoribosylamino)uracil reductase RibD n=1 Tax=Methylibium sp. TaxID=2067992 RepID=UPI003D0A1F8E
MKLTPSESWALALRNANEAIGLSDPNPRVGCVITAPDGRLLSSGHTQRAGSAHAEVAALRAAQAAGHTVRGGTAWVTLEPCSHHGRTPPCCDALIEAGLAHVMVALQDPNPLVAGHGIGRLRAAGIDVTVLEPDDPVAIGARELNIGFLSRMLRQRPWVRLKIAASLDGRTALDNGLSQWITGDAARTDGHAYRKRAGAVLTGIGTVIDDDPRLDVRLVDTVLQPCRVVVDSKLDIALDARILAPPGERLVYTASALTRSAAPKVRELAEQGVSVLACANAEGKVDLGAMLDDLARREINELHVEAGSKLSGSFVRAGLVDEFLVYLAPLMLGAGREMARFGPLAALTEGLALEFTGVERVGADLRLIARPPGRADF